MAAEAHNASVPGVSALLQNMDKDEVKKTADNYVDFFDKSKGAFYLR